jgi:hypothetical protein
MQSIESRSVFPLASVKPLGPLANYRRNCFHLTRQALGKSSRRRERSPVGGRALEPYGVVEDLPYGRCPESGSLFLMDLPDSKEWAKLLADVLRMRHSPEMFHRDLAQSRADNVYAPKLEWIRETLRFQGVRQPKIFEATTPPSDFTQFLNESGLFSKVTTVNEMELLAARTENHLESVDAAILLESLDRVDDPAGLVRRICGHLLPGGLLFLTALVASGFDMAVLGLSNLYLYPPDRANCFTLKGLSQLLEKSGFTLLEVSTPGVLDVQIVRAHLEQDPGIAISPFERQLLEADAQTQEVFQSFLQQQGLSSFARIVAKRSE